MTNKNPHFKQEAVDEWVRVCTREMVALKGVLGNGVTVKAVEAGITNTTWVSWVVLTGCGHWAVVHNPGVPSIVRARLPCHAVKEMDLASAIARLRQLPGGGHACVFHDTASSDWYTKNAHGLYL